MQKAIFWWKDCSQIHRMLNKQMSCNDEFTWTQWFISCFSLSVLCCCSLWTVVKSVVINMTNHIQLILFPWYMPFEATLQAQLGVAHQFDLIHKQWIISPSCFNYSSATRPPLYVLHTVPCRNDLHCNSEAKLWGFHQQRRIWMISQCDLILMTASSLYYYEVTQMSTNSRAETKNHSVLYGLQIQLPIVDHGASFPL